MERPLVLLRWLEWMMASGLCVTVPTKETSFMVCAVQFESHDPTSESDVSLSNQ